MEKRYFVTIVLRCCTAWCYKLFYNYVFKTIRIPKSLGWIKPGHLMRIKCHFLIKNGTAKIMTGIITHAMASHMQKKKK